MAGNRKIISVKEETYNKLLQKKLSRQVKISREITWDDFFMELMYS